MKYRLIASALVVAVLGALALAFNDDQPPRRTPAATADDAAFRSLGN